MELPFRFTPEQIQFVSETYDQSKIHYDKWKADKTYKDRDFTFHLKIVFDYSRNNGDKIGWEGIAKDHPIDFADALNLAVLLQVNRDMR